MPNEGAVNTETVDIAYDGPALLDGVMDVRDLGPALVSVGDLFERANRILNSDRARVSVRVRANFERGSFQIALDFWQLVPQAATEFLVGQGVHQANEILKFLGIGGGVTGLGLGLVQLIRWLKSRIPTATEKRGTEVTIRCGGDFVNVENAVFNLFSDGAVRRDVQGVLEPLRSQGIDKFLVRRRGVDAEVIEKSEVDYFKFEELQSQPTIESESEELLEGVKPFFHEDLRWSLWTLDGTRVGVEMSDEELTARCRMGRERFAKVISCAFVWKTRAWKAGGEWKVERRVTEVLEHTHPEDTTGKLL